MTTVLCVPQWQGSASDRARRPVAGAHRAAALVPADTMVTVPVLDDGGEKVAGVRALEVLVENQRRIRDALAGIDDQRRLRCATPTWLSSLGCSSTSPSHAPTPAHMASPRHHSTRCHGSSCPVVFSLPLEAVFEVRGARFVVPGPFKVATTSCQVLRSSALVVKPGHRRP